MVSGLAALHVLPVSHTGPSSAVGELSKTAAAAVASAPAQQTATPSAQTLGSQMQTLASSTLSTLLSATQTEAGKALLASAAVQTPASAPVVAAAATTAKAPETEKAPANPIAELGLAIAAAAPAVEQAAQDFGQWISQTAQDLHGDHGHQPQPTPDPQPQPTPAPPPEPQPQPEPRPVSAAVLAQSAQVDHFAAMVLEDIRRPAPQAPAPAAAPPVQTAQQQAQAEAIRTEAFVSRTLRTVTQGQAAIAVIAATEAQITGFQAARASFFGVAAQRYL